MVLFLRLERVPMHPSVRAVFFWILVISFFITSPIIILYLMGYRYSFDRGVFVYTGSITVSGNPANDLAISVDGKTVSAQTNQINRSFHIEGIKPGAHSLSVSAPGFTSWNKDIVVRSGISTEFWNVLLARKHYETKTIATPEGSRDFFPSPEGDRFLVISQQERELLLLIVFPDTGRVQQVFSSLEFAFDENALHGTPRWSAQNGSKVIIPLLSRTTRKTHRFVIDTDTLSAVDLKDIAPIDSIRDVRWSQSNGTVLALSGTTLWEISLTSPFSASIISDTADAFDTLGSSVVVLENETGILSNISIRNPGSRRQITTAPAENFPRDRAPFFSVIPYDETRIVLIDPEEGQLFLFNKGEFGESIRRLSSSARGAQFSDDGKKLLYWTDWEMFALFTREWEVQPLRKEGEQIDIGRFSGKISFVQWTKDYEHVVFSIDKTIRFTELDERGSRNTFDIVSLPSLPYRVSSIGSKNEILFLSPGTDSSPHEPVSLSIITFPEPTGFFGFKR